MLEVTMDQLLEAYIQSGLALVPAPRGKKGPRTVGWNERGNTITSVTDLYRLKNMNVGIAHAYCSPTPTCAIDVDHGPTAVSYLKKHGVNLAQLIRSTTAPVIASGNPKKLKIIYRLPKGEVPIPTEVLKSDNQIFLEFRCASRSGLTVQDILPGSTHPSGSNYVLLNGDMLDIPEIPSALLEHWRSLQAPKNTSVKPNRRTSDEETPRNVARLKGALAFISADCDYETWRNVVWGILHTNWSLAIDIAEDWSRTATERFDQDAFEILVGSYDNYHESPITVATVFHLAKMGGWYAGSI
jgi:hypothetical protein